MEIKIERGGKYEFATRILARAERLINVLLAERGQKPGDQSYPELFGACFNLCQELMLIRLMEHNWILDDGWLSSRIEKNDLAGLFNELEEFNHLAGIKIFQSEQSIKLGLESKKLAGFVKELYLPGFLPKKSPPEMLGALLEKMGLIHPDQAPFFTPERLVKMMVDESFNHLALGHREIENQEFAVLDPSFGAGNFLIGLLQKMIGAEEDYYAKRPSGLFYPLTRLPDLSRSIEFELRIELFKKHIFGLELSREGKISAIRSLLLVLLKGKPIRELTPGALSFLDQNLAIGDYLIDAPLREQIDLFDRDRFLPINPFNFGEAGSPHHTAMSRGGFDLIIGNPPWLSLKGKRRQNPYSPEVVGRLIQRYHSDSYRPNLFEMFIRRSIELLREKGINCFIVPDRMAENLQFQPLRQFMVEHGEILGLHFREPFPGVVSDTLIYWFQKKPVTGAKKIAISDAQGKHGQTSTQKFAKRGGGIEKEFSPEVSSLLEKIRHQAKGKLSDYLTCGVGLIARPGTIHAEKSDRLEQPIVKGENVHLWKTSGHFYFEFHPHNLLGGTVRYSKLTAKERILVRKTGASLVASLDASGDLVEQSVYFLIGKPGKKTKYAFEYFIALVNSPLLNFYYRNFLVTNPGSTPQLKKFHLDQMPVRRLNLKDQREKELYDKLTTLVREACGSKDGDVQKNLETEINRIVFKLHNLTAAEISMLQNVS